MSEPTPSWFTPIHDVVEEVMWVATAVGVVGWLLGVLPGLVALALILLSALIVGLSAWFEWHVREAPAVLVARRDWAATRARDDDLPMMLRKQAD